MTWPQAGIAELASALRERRISPVELAELALSRLADRGDTYNAVVTLLPERARREARTADRRLAAGSGGPLTGIPYGAKDSFAARGGPTSYGMPQLRDQVLAHDIPSVARLHRAGAVLAAKLGLMNGIGFRDDESPHDSLPGAGRNPWSLERWTGGSSSGSAAAVAAGLLPFALGADSGGSIILPSAYCGITGLRPTRGLVPTTGGLASTPSLEVIGPMARSAADCSIILSVLTGRRSVAARPTHEPGHARGLRVGWAEGDLETAAPGALAALQDGLRALRDAGMSLVDSALPDLPIRWALRTIALAETAHHFEPFIDGGPVHLSADPRQRPGIEAARTIPAADYLRARDVAARMGVVFDALFRDMDMLVTYSSPDGAPPIDAAFEPIPAWGGLTALLYGSILAGLPAVNLPCGLTTDGLPVGLLLVARRGADQLLLDAATAVQDDTDWHRMQPAMA